MSSLVSSLQHVKNAIADFQCRTANVNPDSDLYVTLIEETLTMIKRRKLLETYNTGRVAQVDEVNADIDARLKKLTEELEGERMERLANIEHDFEDKVKELPELPCAIEREFSTRVGTGKLVARYMKKYADDFKAVTEEKIFFHAAACSNWRKYVLTEFDGKIDELNNYLWKQANLPNDTKYPLTLADVDRIIHLPSYNEDILVVLDTSLRVILTNAGYSKEHEYPFLVVYDSITHKFVPISRENKNNKEFCKKCFRYGPDPCPCQSQFCPICLRTGDDVKCSKPFAESKFQICPKCNAHCHTDDCFQAHQKICPCPVSGLHDDIVELIKSIVD